LRRRTPKRFALAPRTILRVFSLDREIVQLRDDAVLDDAVAAPLIALERRERVSLYGELRFLTWGGVMVIVTGVGVLVSKNLDRIGPLVIAIAIAAAAAACYAWSEWRRRASKREGFRHSLLDDFVLLLAALLASADVGFIEHQWNVLGAHWQRHFLLLAVLHGVTAYIFNSRLVLSLSVSSLAAFLGIERRFDTIFSSTVDMATRAFACAAIVFAWRAIDAIVRARAAVIPSREGGGSANSSTVSEDFSPVFDNFGTNLAFWGALILTADEHLYLPGFLVAVVFAVLSMQHGRKVREELFVIYAWVYGLIAVNILFYRLVKEPVLSSLFAIISITGAIIGLFVIHMRMREARS
jgi:Predicted membrane protein (DUF2157)